MAYRGGAGPSDRESKKDQGLAVISLDCEGLWGLTSRLHQYRGTISHESLTWAYRRLIESLGRRNLSATFAFVSLFASDPEAAIHGAGEYLDNDDQRKWVAPALLDLKAGVADGWCLPEALTWVRAAGNHEIASHSFTHTPILESAEPSLVMEREIAGVRRWAHDMSLSVSTYVFPRNQVGGIDRMADMLGYRTFSMRQTAGERLLDEFNVKKRSEDLPPRTEEGPVAIPGGVLMNWRCGVRRLIPPAVTIRRWRSMLLDAAQRGGVAHLWLHPHNLITGHRQMELLEDMLDELHAMVKQNRIRVVTQREYCLAVG